MTPMIEGSKCQVDESILTLVGFLVYQTRRKTASPANRHTVTPSTDRAATSRMAAISALYLYLYLYYLLVLYVWVSSIRTKLRTVDVYQIRLVLASVGCLLSSR